MRMKGTGELFAMKRLKKTDILSKEQVRSIQLTLERSSGAYGEIACSGKTFSKLDTLAVCAHHDDPNLLNLVLTLLLPS